MEELENAGRRKKHMPNGLRLETLMLLYHKVENVGRIHEDDSDIHQHKSFFGVVDLGLLGQIDQGLGAVAYDGLLKLAHCLRQNLRRRYGRSEIFTRGASRR